MKFERKLLAKFAFILDIEIVFCDIVYRINFFEDEFFHITEWDYE